MKKIAGSTTTVYLGKDFDVEGTTATKYIFLGDQRVSSKKSDGSFFFYHTDYISSSNVITDSSGNQTALYEYDPYGTTVTHTGATEVKHRFTGQEADDSTGLYYYGARYMDPQLGRFITADGYVQSPTDPQSYNRYSYAKNNPIKFTDPTGNFWFLAPLIIALVKAAIIGAAIGAALGALDAAVSGRSVAQGALKGATGGAIGGAIGGVAFGTASAVLGQAAKPIFAVVGLGLSSYSAVQNFKEGNYFSGGFSAIMAFKSASEIYSMSKATNPSSSSGGQGSTNGSNNNNLDASPASSVSGSGNEKVELKTRDNIRKVLYPSAPEPQFNLAENVVYKMVDFSNSDSVLRDLIDIKTGIPNYIKAISNSNASFTQKFGALINMEFNLLGEGMIKGVAGSMRVNAAQYAGNFSRWSRAMTAANHFEQYGVSALKAKEKFDYLVVGVKAVTKR